MAGKDGKSGKARENSDPPSLFEPGACPGEDSHPWHPALGLLILIRVPLI